MTAGVITATPSTVKRRYVNSEIGLTVNVYDLANTLTTPSQITFTWKSTRAGLENSATPVNTGTGAYTVSFKPDRSGNVYFLIKTTSPDAAYEGSLAVADTRFKP